MEPSVVEAILARVRSIPISSTLEFEVESVEDGACTLRVPRRRKYDGIHQSFHGGILMTAADSAAAFATLTTTSAGERIATTDMSIRFLAKCLTDVRVVARVVKTGRTLVPVGVEIFDSDGVLVAIAQVTYMRLGGDR
jgi:acyl-CoA thioesterase